MGGVRVIVLAIAALAFAAPAQAQSTDPLPWTDMLPALPGGADVQPGPVPNCRVATVHCVDRAARRMRRMADRFGCDHRGIFPTTYFHVTRLIADRIRTQPGFFDDNEYLIYEAQVFANYFYRAYRRQAKGLPIPPAWQVAFDTWENADTNGVQDMMLGINAHVQRDMPFVLAGLGLRKPDGTSRKPDHDRENEILAEAYQPIVDEIGARYDSMVTLADSDPNPADDIFGLQLTRSWREGVWRNAERLLNARTRAEWNRVAWSIELNAEQWARMIAAPVVPGYRATRDAYCAEHFHR